MKAHRTDSISLAFGLIFLAIVGWWFLVGTFDLSLPNVRWFMAGALIVLGVLGVVGALRTNRTPAGMHRPAEMPGPPADPDSAATDELPIGREQPGPERAGGD